MDYFAGFWFGFIIVLSLLVVYFFIQALTPDVDECVIIAETETLIITYNEPECRQLIQFYSNSGFNVTHSDPPTLASSGRVVMQK